MKPDRKSRAVWLTSTAALIIGLLWLDSHRGGPASMMSRCNLLLSRNTVPAADILIVGSSRSGTALDPIAMQQTLTHTSGRFPTTVERIAMGHNPPRASQALIENYLKNRGTPRVIVLEIMFLTQRSVDRLAQRRFEIPPEQYLFRREVNLMTFGQILSMPSIAMPYSEQEGLVNLWRYRVRGAVLRAGALVYQFLRRPVEKWNLSACSKDTWTREPTWPADFAFSFGGYNFDGAPGEMIARLEAEIAETAPTRELKPWQVANENKSYPYHFDEPYRAGEVALLRSMLALASRHDVPVVLLPLPLYGHAISPDDLQALDKILTPQAQLFDLYGQVNGNLAKFWYDDAHLEAYPAGALTTAILAQHLAQSGLLKESGANND